MMKARLIAAFAAALLAQSGVAALLVSVGTPAHAQAKVTAVPNPAAGNAARTNPSAPNPTGLPSRFPAGLPSPQPYPQGLPDVTPPSPATDGTLASQPPGAVLAEPPAGTAVVGGPGVPAAPQSVPSGSSGYSNVQIAASFRRADANLDGELTRAEAQRLTIMPASFEEMDRNKDGILSRWEYEDGLR